MAGRGLSKQTFADQVPKHPSERIGMGAGGGGEVVNPRDAGGQMVGDTQSDHHVNAPRSAKVAERPKVHLEAGCFYPAAAVDKPEAFLLRKHSRQ